MGSIFRLFGVRLPANEVPVRPVCRMSCESLLPSRTPTISLRPTISRWEVSTITTNTEVLADAVESWDRVAASAAPARDCRAWPALCLVEVRWVLAHTAEVTAETKAIWCRRADRSVSAIWRISSVNWSDTALGIRAPTALRTSACRKRKPIDTTGLWRLRQEAVYPV